MPVPGCGNRCITMTTVRNPGLGFETDDDAVDDDDDDDDDGHRSLWLRSAYSPIWLLPQ